MIKLAQTDSNSSSNNNYNRKMVMSHEADESVDPQTDTQLSFLFSDVTRTPISTGMTARSQRIQRMAPFHDVTFEGCGALCARLATKRLLQHDTSCCKVSFGSAFDGFDLKFAPGDSEIP